MPLSQKDLNAKSYSEEQKKKLFHKFTVLLFDFIVSSTSKIILRIVYFIEYIN